MAYDLKKIMAEKPSRFTEGHRMCAGCGAPVVARMVLRALKPEDHAVIANATGCMEVSTFIYPYTAWTDSFIHTAFENAGATCSGAEAAYRSLKKQVWLNSKENELLKNKCMKAGISESAFFRLVIENTEIKEKPDENFYRILNDLRGVAVNINQLARVANSYQYVDDNKYYPLANKINNMVDDLQKFYLTPTKKE